jgi:hypothetical protein
MVASAGLPVPDGPRRVPRPAHPAHRSAVAFKDRVRTRIGELAADVHPASAGDRETLAD